MNDDEKTLLVCAVTGVIIAAVSLACTGCGAACQTERMIVDSLGAGIDAADDVVGSRGGEEYDTASWIAHGAQSLGSIAVDSCDLLRSGESSGWQHWLLMAVEAATAIVGIIDGANANIEETAPLELLRAIAMLEWAIDYDAPLEGAP